MANSVKSIEALAEFKSRAKRTSRKTPTKQKTKTQDKKAEEVKVPAKPRPQRINFTEKVKEHRDVIFEPNPGPQTDFLAATEQEVLYGGAAGGGKVVLEDQSVLTPSGFKEIKEL